MKYVNNFNPATDEVDCDKISTNEEYGILFTKIEQWKGEVLNDLVKKMQINQGFIDNVFKFVQPFEYECPRCDKDILFYEYKVVRNQRYHLQCEPLPKPEEKSEE